MQYITLRRISKMMYVPRLISAVPVSKYGRFRAWLSLRGSRSVNFLRYPNIFSCHHCYPLLGCIYYYYIIIIFFWRGTKIMKKKILRRRKRGAANIQFTKVIWIETVQMTQGKRHTSRTTTSTASIVKQGVVVPLLPNTSANASC